jgi:hypothetical protein
VKSNYQTRDLRRLRTTINLVDAVANQPTKDIEHDVAGLSGSPAISDNLMIATVPHNYLALPETASR